jgi:tricarballylate dehydrogenase
MKTYNCDVLVVGCGAAGLTSALAALENGASVIILERSPKEDRGGNTRWTEALLRLKSTDEVSDDFVSWYAAQCGYHIAPRYIKESAESSENWSTILRTLPYLDPELLDAFASGVPEAIRWLQSYGVKFHTTEYPMIFSAPLRGICGGGEALVETLCPIIEEKGAQFIYDMTATQFLLDEDLSVLGVKALHSRSGAIEIRAKNTVLACGGFEGNPAMIAQYMGPNARFTRPVAPGGWYNKGEGIRLALDIGAAPAGDFTECHRQPIDPRSSVSEALVGAYPLGIVVNSEGRRFMDEAPAVRLPYLEEHCRQINRQPGGIAHFIYDDAINDVPSWRRMIRSDQLPVEANSLDELAAKIAVPSATLKETVNAYNAACAKDGRFAYRRDDATANATFERDGVIDREVVFDGLSTSGLVPPKSNWARPITGPIYRSYPIISSNTFTCGGLKVTKDAQVVRTSGACIPGLYAAGETMGIIYGVYIGATSVLRGITFGRLAGRHASIVTAPGRPA